MSSDLKPIAIREVRYRRADGREERIRVTLNAPAADVQDWSCSYSIAGFGRHIERRAFGVDAIQALVLAIHVLPIEVRGFAEAETGQFVDEPDLGVDRACRMNLDEMGSAAANEFVTDCVRRLSGPHADDAWHRLVEAGPEVIPSIVRTLRTGIQPRIQAELVRALASYRSSDTITVLSDLVVSGESEVWKAALDALVTVGGDDARRALQQASHLAAGERRSWIAEAIEQVDSTGRLPG